MKGLRVNNGFYFLDFYHNKVRFRLYTTYKDTKENHTKAAKLLTTLKIDLERNTFYVANFKHQIKNISLLANLDANFKINMRNNLLSDLIIEQLLRYEKRWISNKMAESTYRMYKTIVTKRLLPFFGDTPLADLTTYDIDQFISTLNLSKVRTNFIISPLKEIYNRHKRQGIINTNPFDNIDNSDDLYPGSKYNAEPFNSDEKQKIIDTATGQLRNIIQFAFWTGCRIGEILALTWEDVDFEREVIQITKSKSLGKITNPKTQAGIREVELTPLALSALIAQRQYTTEAIFHNPFTNRPWSKADAFRRYWVNILNEAEIKYRHPHIMRHTFISYMLSLGNMPESLYKIVGHENTEQIYKTYGKYIKGEKKGKQLIT